MTGAPTAAQLAKLSKAMYQDGPLLLRTLQHWRPYICPFENLLGHVPEGSRVLDIGCGSGLLLGLTAGVGVQFEGVGFNVSRQGIELATRMSRSASVRAKREVVVSPAGRRGRLAGGNVRCCFPGRCSASCGAGKPREIFPPGAF